MHKVYNKKMPQVILNRFTKNDRKHSYETRSIAKANYYLPRARKTFGQKSIEFRGAKVWNKIDIETKNKAFKLFKRKYKEKLLKNYANASAQVIVTFF